MSTLPSSGAGPDGWRTGKEGMETLRRSPTQGAHRHRDRGPDDDRRSLPLGRRQRRRRHDPGQPGPERVPRSLREVHGPRVQGDACGLRRGGPDGRPGLPGLRARIHLLLRGGRGDSHLPPHVLPADDGLPQRRGDRPGRGGGHRVPDAGLRHGVREQALVRHHRRRPQV